MFQLIIVSKYKLLSRILWGIQHQILASVILFGYAVVRTVSEIVN